jgi:hypothetical protein
MIVAKNDCEQNDHKMTNKMTIKMVVYKMTVDKMVVYKMTVDKMTRQDACR